MTITFYGHACFKLDSLCGSILFDPFAPGKVPGWKLPALEADKVLCSHGHSDHNWAEGVALTGRPFTGEIVRIPSFHDDKRGLLRGKNTITLVEAEGLRVVHMGDIGCALTAEQIAALGRVDVLMIPVGGHYTVDAAQAWEIVRSLDPAIVMPMHYSGKGFGYSVIASVEPFLRLAGNVKDVEGMSYTVDLADAPATIVFRR
ncbi:MAG: MBL fold metallo-hydrolase [Oscillospiraceae bacterium]|nr:MBL fold metallo-hydrolase [Oscillospiraceae bacterium]